MPVVQICAAIHPEQQQFLLGLANSSPSACQSAGPTCAGDFRSLCDQSWINNNCCYTSKVAELLMLFHPG